MTSQALLVRIRRGATDQWEAQATDDEMLDWARQQPKWPTRRYRLEGSQAGTSALTTLASAHRLQRRCGGKVRMVIPTAKQAAQWTAAVAASKGEAP